MRVTIKISGNPGLAIQAKVAAFKAQANNAIQGAGINTQAYAKQACKVKTGRLRSSIQYRKTSESSCTVGTDVKYGPDVEFGHHTRLGTGAHGISPHAKGIAFVPPSPFLFPAHAQASRELRAELKAVKA
jgi:hypothetical protein